MPVKIPSSLPAVEILKAENIFVMDDLRASTQDIRPLKLLILNLMPLKIVTETDLLRLISNTPLQIELDFMSVSGHISRNTPLEHIDTFYKDFDEIRSQNYDGMIITGAPVEKLQFEEVDYWNELVEIFDWAHKHVTSTLYICWAALAGLYHFYGIPKHPLDKKLFGVFAHHKYDERNPIFRGFDDLFYVPHSRYSEVRRADIEKDKSLGGCGSLYGHGSLRQRVFHHGALRIFGSHARHRVSPRSGERPRHCPPPKLLSRQQSR